MARLHVIVVVWESLFSVCLLHNCVFAQKLDLTAYEYQRKFHKDLDLGQCPTRYVLPDSGKPVKQGCPLVMLGDSSAQTRHIDHVTNIHVGKADRLMKLLGLCNGDTASYMGLLHKGDCYAVDIAQKVRFTPKSYIRLFLHYYRREVAMLAPARILGPVPLYNDTYFVSDIGYGSLEAVIVEAVYSSKRHRKKLKLPPKSGLSMNKFYDYLVSSPSGVPYKVKIIRLSTAQNILEIKKFRGEYTQVIMKQLEDYNSEIRKQMTNIRHNVTSPHYNYRLEPFVIAPRTAPLVRASAAVPTTEEPKSKQNYWFQMSSLQLKLKGTLSKSKPVYKKCRKYRGNITCQQVIELYRKIRLISRTLHDFRKTWGRLSITEQKSLWTDVLPEAMGQRRNLINVVREFKKKSKRAKQARALLKPVPYMKT